MNNKILAVACLAAVAFAERASHSHEHYDPDPYDKDRYDPDPYDKDRYDSDPYDKDRYDPDPYDDKGHHGGSSYHDSYNKKPDYNFHYKVKDKYYNDFGHWEERKGYLTKGWYYVVLPDYRRQNVHYTVDGKKGYVATVTYTPVKKDKHHKGGHGHGSYEHDPYKPKSYEDDPYKHGSYEDDPYKRGSYEDDPYKRGSYEHDPYKPKSYEHDPYKRGSYEDDRYKDGSDEHGSYRPYKPRPSYKPDSHEYGPYTPRPYY